MRSPYVLTDIDFDSKGMNLHLCARSDGRASCTDDCDDTWAEVAAIRTEGPQRRMAQGGGGGYKYRGAVDGYFKGCSNYITVGGTTPA